MKPKAGSRAKGRNSQQVVGMSNPQMDITFQTFVGLMKSRDPLIGAFKAHVDAEGFPDAATWGQVRLVLSRAGADEPAMVGARMAWRAFRNRSRNQA